MCGQKYQGYSLTFWPKLAHFHHLSICNQNQSISILVISRQNTKVIALLFGQNSLIFITFQSAIKINQFQLWSFLGKIPRLQPYFLAKNRSFSSLFNLQSKSINSILIMCGQKYQGYSLTFWPKLAHFHHLSICNQNQSISILVISRQNTKVIALLFGQNSLIFITFQSAIKINQCQFWSFVGKIPRLQPYFLAKNASFSSLFNLQSKSINSILVMCGQKYQGYSLNCWPKIPHCHHSSICYENQSISILVMFRQNTKVIALLFGQKSLIFITFQSAIKINQFNFDHVWAKILRLQPYFLAKNRSFSSLFNLQSKSINVNVGHLSAKYQGYSLTFWPQNRSLSSLFNLQSKSINFNFGHLSAKYQGYSLTSWPQNRSFSSLFNLQSKSINFNFGHLSAKYQGYSLTFWPKIPHVHHFSICNQNQSMSMLVICRQNTKVIALLFGHKIAHFHHFSICNQNQSISILVICRQNTKVIALLFGHKIAHFHHFSICNQNQSMSILVICRQNTKVIALRFGQKSLMFITFQSAIKINQCQFWSFVGKIPRLQPYVLAKNPSCSSLFNLQLKSINVNFGHLSENTKVIVIW